MSKPAAPAPELPRWLAFVTSLAVDEAATRMKILRTLETLGSAVLREGVYLLPESPANRAGLQRLADYIARMNGTAHLLTISSADEAQAKLFRGMFDRTRLYVDLIKTIEGLKAGFGVSDPTAIQRVLAKQRRDLETISALDFFNSPYKERAERILAEHEEAVRRLMFPADEAPHEGKPVSRSARQFFRRAWATRKPLFPDRLASAWLIRRFIDAEAILIWLEKGQPCPATAVGFAFDGAMFRNSRSRVTYQELLANFGLEKNPALVRIGRLVHALDAGDKLVPEAAGVETLLHGAQRRATTDDELLVESEKTFDLLYEAYFELPAKA